jgi:D-alanyl-lipoteichoic acid acyltransferase DltB (MBOAT superfamily)
MPLYSLIFLFFCMAVVAAVHFVRGKRLRQLLLSVANAAFLLTFVPDRRSALYFAVVLAGTYIALILVRMSRRGAVVTAAIGLTVLAFLYLKRFTFFANWVPVPYEWDLSQHPVELVGLSYMLFKLIHMLIDEWQGQLAPFNLWSYLNYQLAFFTLTAGPIQRYNDFQKSWEDMTSLPTEFRESALLWCRILLGLLKIGILGGWVLSIYAEAANPQAPRDLTNIVVQFYMFPLYIYLNFSGYTDVMIGVGGLLGFKVPENFNYPFLARNVLDFWDRWHISLSHWIRDYVFMSSYKAAATSFPRATRYWAYALLFMALFLAGVWHGTTENFVMFGLLNGVGAAVARMYGDGLRGLLGRKGLHAYLQNRVIRWIAVLITLHFTCLSLLFFSTFYDQAMLVLTTAWSQFLGLRISAAGPEWGLRGVLILVTAILLTVLWKFDAISSLVAGIFTGVARQPAVLCTVLCTMTALIVAVLFFDWTFQQIPPPVHYMAF